ncbi:MAG: methyltransferase [Phenylobacterium sp. RIFCSPHIGHO2_01_FULL_69_31]|uniref:class I SAM-dependent methyltransferase n=1 Tax=Phenylobacterium sp. RIFCSPHIGHO2_01_FULL_69_31 TaxID=1801944 RepID=UPI0008CFDBE5|nr:class I SAM-dependent methyltransferase [Phenylobacterium sp. RIFCSPHIGHO2_01_FULL_69_31]OHB29320.1 MAG: methyltransferase [Phenylobacterium sp. RIFCSPHIGHO2_01_FULL_69_31]
MTVHQLVAAACPVCGHSVAVPFLDGGRHPLATLGWPASTEEALTMARLPHDFVQCPNCTHVWNRSFRYEDVPYKDSPNRMFNNGVIWQGHLAESCELLVRQMPPNPTLVEIGCGEGHFLRALANACGGAARIIGFDPSTHPETGQGFEFHARLFDPLEDIAAFRPDAVVVRHVIEHLTAPATLIEQLAWGASQADKDVWLFAESPCIDRVFDTGRLADFFYEHVSHFSTESFRTLMGRAGDIFELSHGYDGEVVYGLVRLDVPDARKRRAQSSSSFYARAAETRAAVARQIDALAARGATVAVWGGTGKGATFMHQFGLDACRFPLVVDSDPTKVGTYVPGVGQIIQFRDVLKTQPPAAVLIPTQWRAADIVREMEREGIVAETVLIEHNGRLIDYRTDPHPYR